VIAAKLHHSGVNRIKGLQRFRKTRLNGQIIAMTDTRDHSEHFDPTAAEKERAEQERRAAEQQALADKLAKRPPPNPVERAEIEKGQEAHQSPRATALSIEDRRTGLRLLYPVSDAGSCRGVFEQRLRPSCGLSYVCA
jgi:hypothetical protein